MVVSLDVYHDLYRGHDLSLAAVSEMTVIPLMYTDVTRNDYEATDRHLTFGQFKHNKKPLTSFVNSLDDIIHKFAVCHLVT